MFKILGKKFPKFFFQIFKYYFDIFTVNIFLKFSFFQILSLGWAERNLYAFISMESFSCVIALYRMTTVGSLEKFEQSLANLKRMRVSCSQEISKKT